MNASRDRADENRQVAPAHEPLGPLLGGVGEQLRVGTSPERRVQVDEVEPPRPLGGVEFRTRQRVVAERANRITGYENPIALDTLAAAYAALAGVE